MASVFFDKSTGWWIVRYYAGPEVGRRKTGLCRHPSEWSKARPPRKAPEVVQQLARPYKLIEERAKLGIETAVRSVPLRAAVDAYRRHAALSQRPATQSAVRNAAEKFIIYCEGRGIKTLEQVTHVVCREWIAARLEAGANRSSVITERSNLRPIFSQAFQDRRIKENPWTFAKVPGKPRREPPTAWTEEEVARLLAETDGWLRDLIVLGVNTGIRITALLSLPWSQIDWAAGLVRVGAKASKSGRAYDVPMNEAVHDTLARRLADTAEPHGPIFLNPETGRPYRSRTTFERIRAAVRRTGISDHGDYNHCMRRTFATLALNSGVPLEVVSRCLGHATLAQTERAYAHLLNDRIKTAMAGFNLPGLQAPPPPGPGTASTEATSPGGDSAAHRRSGSRSGPPPP